MRACAARAIKSTILCFGPRGSLDASRVCDCTAVRLLRDVAVARHAAIEGGRLVADRDQRAYGASGAGFPNGGTRFRLTLGQHRTALNVFDRATVGADVIARLLGGG